ncbi:hypothetical protein GGR28_000810 [Lewinella aquimaris]|uniref:Outer membrane protein beta-barrel domain-containing protein n=1 Tax=Neolewinella aquimaris TaxID=1835722 RepID=A0A840E8T0_9BACT|nr:hypothetical protein [Neolewinella aquimaris]MBB4078209.1 hypothetical protein [Neolewinella aquimaris]
MRFWLFLLFLPTVVGTAGAQVGLTGFHNFNDANTTIGDQSSDLGYENGQDLALNYWFRLPKKRVEFLPTVYGSTTRGEVKWSEFGFQFRTNVYPFDFGTDCDCPTFGKQGPQLQKGLFLQLSPGVAYHRLGEDGNREALDKVAFTLGGGIGIDFGVSNLLTLTPILAVRHTLTDFADVNAANDDQTGLVESRARLTTLQLGLQATFRFDKKRY